MDGPWPENKMNLIDGLLIKKGVSQKQKQVVHSVELGITPLLGKSALNHCAGWNELLVMADQGGSGLVLRNFHHANFNLQLIPVSEALEQPFGTC